MAMDIKSYSVNAQAPSEFGKYEVSFIVEGGNINSISATLYNEDGNYIGNINKDYHNINCSVNKEHTADLAAVVTEFNALCEEAATWDNVPEEDEENA